jgi:hypothetical protein
LYTKRLKSNDADEDYVVVVDYDDDDDNNNDNSVNSATNCGVKWFKSSKFSEIDSVSMADRVSETWYN